MLKLKDKLIIERLEESKNAYNFVVESNAGKSNVKNSESILLEFRN